MRSWMALVASCILMSFAPILVRLSQVDPTATLWLRMILAAGILVTMVRKRALSELGTRADKLLLLAAGLLSTADLLLNHWAIAETTVANAVLLLSLSPVFVTLLAFVFLRERPRARQLIGYAMAIAGAMVMTGLTLEGLRFGLGEALALLSAFFYASYFLVLKRLRERVSAIVISIWTSAIAALALAPVAIAESDPLFPRLAIGWLPIVLLAIAVQVGGYGLFAFAMRALPVSYSSASLLARPVLAASAAWMVLGEAMTRDQIMGAALVLGGLAFSSFRNAPAKGSATLDQPEEPRRGSGNCVEPEKDASGGTFRLTRPAPEASPRLRQLTH